MTLCEYDKAKKCIIDKYWWCMDCYKSLNNKNVRRKYKKGKIYRRDTRECIMCALVNASPDSNMTEHHIVPNGLARKHLSHKIGETVNMCFNHHKLFEALIEPIIDILNSKSQPYQSRKELTDYLLYMKLPELVKRINGIIGEVYKQ